MGICIALLCIAHPAIARIELAHVFGDHMVLQADMPIEVWGAGAPGEAIAVTLGKATRSTVANAKGQWLVSFAPRAASREAIQIQVQGSNAIRVKNVLVGEVWLAAGQSNMAWPLSRVENAQSEIEQSDQPELRLYHFAGSAPTGARAYSPEELSRLAPEDFLSGDWKPCSPETAASFSAVAYFFGKRLHQELQVPIGILCPPIGGTPTEAWIRRDALVESQQLSTLVKGPWLENQGLCEWCRERAKVNLDWGVVDRSKLLGDDLGPYHPYQPGYMWQAGIAPLRRLRLRGVIWYQGESNAESANLVAQHRPLLETLVTDWRTQFRHPSMPFLFVQLPGLNRPHWPAFRQSQLECSESIENADMVVTIDLGHPTNVHPPDKQPIGNRLANLALDTVYARSDGHSFPIAVDARIKGQTAWITFEETGDALVSKDGDPIRHFEIAGNDRKFVPASARLERNSIVVWNDDVLTPRFVRYAWLPYPRPPINLFNEAGLPASPFKLPVKP